MKVIKVETIGSYGLITEAASVTRGSLIYQEPNLKRFEKWIISEHSPIRRVQVAVTVSAKSEVISHLVRHAHALHYVQTGRPDITGHQRTDDERYYLIQANLQEWLQIARMRLCNKSANETQEMVEMIKDAFTNHDEYLEVLSRNMLPKCYHIGRCNEPWGGCGLFEYKGGLHG